MFPKRVKKGYSSSFKKREKQIRKAGMIAAYSTSVPSESYEFDDCKSNYQEPSSAGCSSHVISETEPAEIVYVPETSSSPLKESGLELPSCIPFSSKLSLWAIQENITHSALGKLLKILKDVSSVHDLKSLPLDSRTLLHTPTTLITDSMGHGRFFYFGIRETILYLCKKYSITLNVNDNFHIAVNIDGVPLFKSTNESFWPILCLINSIEILKCEVFCVALYEGIGKPESNEFLKLFIEEASHLTNNGILIGSTYHKFKISKLICDSPAKSYVLKTKGHSGYFSCPKCTLEGDYEDNVFFSETNFSERTDFSFRSKIQPEHHTGTSLFENIPKFNMIINVPIDYMHCILLGVMKRLLCHKKYGWIYGKPPFKSRASKVQELNADLNNIKKFIPCEFSRKTRSINDCKRYKATEFRLLLLYTGPIVFKNFLSNQMYENFLCLSVGTLILCSASLSKDETFLDYANELFKHFIINSINLYNPNFVSLNVHNLLHITDCVRLYGVLDNFSAFPFENYMPQITKKVRKASLPLEQVVRRIIEQREKICNIPQTQNKMTFCIEHSTGPLLEQCRSPQFKILKTDKFILKTSKICHRFIQLKNNDIVEVLNIATHEDETVIIGYSYKKNGSLFKVPADSINFGIFFVEKTEEQLNMYSIKNIKSKIMILLFKGKYVCFPLLHV